MVNFKKSTKGITLVALIITVIVLVVLAMASIKIAINGGIINRADKENQEFIIRGEKEEMALAYQDFLQKKEWDDNAELKIEGAEVTAGERNEKQGWNVTFLATNHKYFLYSDGKIEEIDVGGRASNTGGATPGEGDTTGGSTSGGTTPSENTTPTEEPEQPTDTTWRDNGDGTYTKNGVTIAIGDYVDYTYDTANAYSLSKSYSGYTSDQSIAQEETASKWRILNVNTTTGTVDLTSELPTVKVYFNGATGYNNGVYLLNKMCAWLYSNKTLGITARSIKIEDIEAQMNATGLAERKSKDCTTGTEPDFGATKTFSGTHTYYPYLYAQEKGSGINSSTVRTDGINQSDSYYSFPTSSAATRASSSKLTVTQTGYTLYHLDDDELDTIFKNNRIRELVFPEDVYTYYWLATRTVTAYNDEYALYGLFIGGRGGVSDESLYGSYPYDYSMPRYLRPIVTVNADWIGSTGGTSSSPRSLTKT